MLTLSTMDKKAQAGGCGKKERKKVGERKVREKRKKKKKINAGQERGKSIYIILGGGRETEEYRKGNTVKLISSRCGDAWQDPLFVPVKLNQKRKI